MKSATATISTEELKGKMDRGEDFVLVETLPAELFSRAHLPGAINLPLDQLAIRAPHAIPNKEQEVIVYCASPT